MRKTFPILVAVPFLTGCVVETVAKTAVDVVTIPVKVAAALEDRKFDVLDGGQGFMRKDDHQFFQPIYVSSFGKLAANEPFDEEGTGWGWHLVSKVDTPQAMVSTTCKMVRP